MLLVSYGEIKLADWMALKLKVITVMWIMHYHCDCAVYSHS